MHSANESGLEQKRIESKVTYFLSQVDRTQLLAVFISDIPHSKDQLPVKNDTSPYSAPAANGTVSLSASQPHSGRFGILLLAIAWVYWWWLLSDLWRKPVGDLLALLVFASVTLAAGACGHLLYCNVLRWRGTVFISLLLGPLLVFGVLGLLFGSVEGMFEILAFPIEFVAHQNWTDRITFSVPIFLSIVILSIAHPLKPNLPNAIITSIGISLWYGLAILMAASAG